MLGRVPFGARVKYLNVWIYGLVLKIIKYPPFIARDSNASSPHRPGLLPTCVSTCQSPAHIDIQRPTVISALIVPNHSFDVLTFPQCFGLLAMVVDQQHALVPVRIRPKRASGKGNLVSLLANKVFCPD